MAPYRGLSYFLRFHRLLTVKLSGLPDLSVASVCGSSVSRVCGLLNLTNVEDSGRTSLRVHLGSLLASGPALALVLHLPVKCGSRTPGLELCCRIDSRKEGCCVSWVPLEVERVVYMTAAYLKALALICLTKLFW